jgi:hypothetical protein
MPAGKLERAEGIRASSNAQLPQYRCHAAIEIFSKFARVDAQHAITQFGEMCIPTARYFWLVV